MYRIPGTGARWAALYGVAQSRTRLTWLSSSSIYTYIFVVQSLNHVLLLGTLHGLPAFSVLHYLPELTQIHVHWVSDAINQLILSCPLLLLPSIFPSIRVFCNGSPLPWDFPSKNTGVGCHLLLQGIFLMQGSKSVSPAWQVGSLPLSHQGGPHTHVCIYICIYICL